jgi:hypothetical protein
VQNTWTDTSPKKINGWQINICSILHLEMGTTTLRYHYTTIIMAKCRILTTSSASENVEQQELSSTTGSNANGAVTWKTVCQCLKTEFHSYYMVQLPCFLVFIQRNWKHVCTKTCSSSNWKILSKQPRYPSIYEHTNELWYIQIMEYVQCQKEIICHDMNWNSRTVNTH